MKTLVVCLVSAMLLFICVERSPADIGIPDHVPAATLIIPFFEVGIDPAINPHDTLPVITNVCGVSLKLHYHGWNQRLPLDSRSRI